MIILVADDPSNDPGVSGDPYKTLFVARLVSSNFCLEFILQSTLSYFA